MSTLLKDRPMVQQAYEKFQQFNRDERLRALDEAHQKFLHDHATDIEESHIKGKAEGKIEGKVEGKIEIARNMKEKGYAANDIAELTGLSSDEIVRLD